MRKVELTLKENLKYNALTTEFKDEIELLYNSKYFDCTYTQFTEYLAERENIFLSVAEVGQILRERYILSPNVFFEILFLKGLYLYLIFLKYKNNHLISYLY